MFFLVNCTLLDDNPTPEFNDVTINANIVTVNDWNSRDSSGYVGMKAGISIERYCNGIGVYWKMYIFNLMVLQMGVTGY